MRYAVDPSAGPTGELAPPRDVAAWPDEWLVEAVRGDPPNEAALDALADRHWRALFGRCQLLTLDRDQASDLAQEAWCRVLRVRRSLRPDGNFPAYLATTATNVWRDRQRSARRAGPMADRQMASLDAALPADEGDGLSFADVLPDLNALAAEEAAQLRMDVDDALSRLTPELREVVVARFLDGESAADIGRRHGRTEQTITAWLRRALREMKANLGESRRAAARKDER